MSTGVLISEVEKQPPVLMAITDSKCKLSRVVGCRVEGVVSCHYGFCSCMEVKAPCSYDAAKDTDCKTKITAEHGLWVMVSVLFRSG